MTNLKCICTEIIIIIISSQNSGVVSIDVYRKLQEGVDEGGEKEGEEEIVEEGGEMEGKRWRRGKREMKNEEVCLRSMQVV